MATRAPSRYGSLCALVLLGSTALAVRADEAAAGMDPTPPLVIHFCWTNCFTLQRSHGLYARVDGSDETWSIERFTPESVVLTRHDAPAAWNGFSAAVTYAGQVSNDQLVKVTVNGNPVPAVRAAWGSALDTLPADNAERNRWMAAQRQAPASDTAKATEDLLSSSVPPPPLPEYEQPPCPEDGYLWTPGYWSWDGTGYHWVPGAWVQPPSVGLLWTPAYWGFLGATYVFHRGYWGPRVGYYGGVNYGYGYGGVGFYGGRWVGGSFAYNRTVSNVNIDVVHNLYHEEVPANGAVQRPAAVQGPTEFHPSRVESPHVAALQSVTPRPITPRPITTGPVTPRPITPLPRTARPVTALAVTPRPVTPLPPGAPLPTVATKPAAANREAPLHLRH